MQFQLHLLPCYFSSNKVQLFVFVNFCKLLIYFLSTQKYWCIDLPALGSSMYNTKSPSLPRRVGLCTVVSLFEWLLLSEWPEWPEKAVLRQSLVEDEGAVASILFFDFLRFKTLARFATLLMMDCCSSNNNVGTSLRSNVNEDKKKAVTINVNFAI